MKTKFKLLAICQLLSVICSSAHAQGTAFTYQGRLNDGANPANGTYDLQFQVFNLASGGLSYGSPNPNTVTNVSVSNGLFTATLDFGNVFPGADRWLEIGVRTNGNGAFTTLVPRQPLTPTPYAVYAANAASAGSVSATNIAGTVTDALLSTNVALRAGGNAFTGNQTVAGGSLQMRGNSPDDAALITAGNSDFSHLLVIFPGRFSDPNPFILWKDGDPLRFATDNSGFSELMRITPSGNVGIGTANPQGSLHVYSANNPTVMRLQSTGTPGFGRLEFVSNPQGDGNEWRPGYIQSTDAGGFTGGLAFIVNGTGTANKFGTNEVMRIVNGGVGINTNNPNGAALAVNGNVTVNGTISGNGSQLTGIIPPPGMVLIPAGSFTMGDALDGLANAVPVSVAVSALYMDVNLVTWSQWQSVYFWATNHGYVFVNAGAGKAANHPVYSVDWYDCVKWCNARSQQAGRPPVYYADAGLTQVYTNGEISTLYPNWAASGYRLPTEAEWEKAARGGLSGQRFPWGNLINQNLANYSGNTIHVYDLGPNGYNSIGSVGGTSPATSPVGSFAANGYGLYDMVGNIFEWCWDWYGTPYAGGSDPHGPAGPLTERVGRGGGWGNEAVWARCANRYNFFPNYPTYNYNNFGFRCVRGI